MESRFEPNIYIRLDKETLEPNEQVNGCILLESHQPFLASELQLMLKCEEKVSIFEKETNPDYSRLSEEERKNNPSVPQYIYKNYKNQNTFYSTTQTIANFNFQVVPAGIYQYPFSFKLHDNVPNSFEHLWKTNQYQNEASITYSLTARIKKDGEKKLGQDSVKFFFIQKTSRGREIENKRVMNHHRVFNWCCSDKGEITLTTYFEKDWYYKDEDVYIVCEIDNSESQMKITQVGCQLDQSLSFKADRNLNKNLKTQLEGEKLEINLEAGKKMTGTNALRLRLPLGPGSKKQKVQSTVSSDIIQCQHDITVRLSLAGCCETQPMNFLHITLFDRPAPMSAFNQMFGPPTTVYNTVVFNPAINMQGPVQSSQGFNYPSAD